MDESCKKTCKKMKLKPLYLEKKCQHPHSSFSMLENGQCKLFSDENNLPALHANAYRMNLFNPCDLGQCSGN